MNDLITRTPFIIAAEINSIKDQTRTMILCNSIEIGRRLHEAKLLVDHGAWGDWLKTSIDYSKSTANNLMRIFDEYGADQIALFGDNSKSQALGNLSYTQAVALLGVPGEEREEFIKENDIEKMSTRELQEAIQARKAAEKRADDAERKNKEILDHSKKNKIEADKIYENNKQLMDGQRDAKKKASDLQLELEKERAKSKEVADRLSSLLKEAQNNGTTEEKIKELEIELKEAQKQVQELTVKINEPITLEPTIIEKIPEEVERELGELRGRVQELQQSESTAKVKCSVYFESIVTGFKNLLVALAEMEEVDLEAHKKYINAVKGLMDKMSEKLDESGDEE